MTKKNKEDAKEASKSPAAAKAAKHVAVKEKAKEKEKEKSKSNRETGKEVSKGRTKRPAKEPAKEKATAKSPDVKPAKVTATKGTAKTTVKLSNTEEDESDDFTRESSPPIISPPSLSAKASSASSRRDASPPPQYQLPPPRLPQPPPVISLPPTPLPENDASLSPPLSPDGSPPSKSLSSKREVDNAFDLPDRLQPPSHPQYPPPISPPSLPSEIVPYRMSANYDSPISMPDYSDAESGREWLTRSRSFMFILFYAAFAFAILGSGFYKAAYQIDHDDLVHNWTDTTWRTHIDALQAEHARKLMLNLESRQMTECKLDLKDQMRNVCRAFCSKVKK